MRNMSRISALAAGLLLTIAAVSSDAGNVYGSGSFSCGDWLSHENESSLRLHQVSWILGYISAAEAYADLHLARYDPSAFEAWVDQYCQRNPSAPIFEATDALIRNMISR